MRWLCLLALFGCRTEPLPAGTDGGPQPQPDLAPRACGGFAGPGCPSSEFCELPAGQCFNDSLGTCRPFPGACSDIFDPVCGCDGVTYPNDCERQSAGAALDFQGQCEPPFDEAQLPIDMARPADLAGDLPCGQSCGASSYCYVPCCGTPGCTPTPPSCQPLPFGCADCTCLTSGGCSCSEDAAGNLTFQCFTCP